MKKSSNISAKLSLNVQHNYITLKTPNGNFTTNYGGASASGRLAENSKAFRQIDNYVQNAGKSGKTYGDAMNDLLNEKLLTSLWPEWDQPAAECPQLDDRVISKKFGNGVVVEIKRKNVFVRFAKNLCGFQPDMFTKKANNLFETF